MRQKFKVIIDDIPLIKSIANRVTKLLNKEFFPGSSEFWEARYAGGETSGAGSYGKLAEYKAEIVNSFVKKYNIHSVIELGCGDGNQLALARYPSYTGIDVSKTAVKMCIEKFQYDKKKSFFLYDTECFVDNHSVFKAELGLSLDVIYHLLEDDVFEQYMNLLFSVAEKFVLIYSSDSIEHTLDPHIKHRKFSDWIKNHVPSWKLLIKYPNKYPYRGDPNTGSFADFFVYERIK